MEQPFDAFGFEPGEHRFMDRGDGAGMAARECDEVLVRLFHRTKPLAEMRDRTLFKGNDRRHYEERIRPERLISY
jgi:hypothetical protein